LPAFHLIAGVVDDGKPNLNRIGAGKRQVDGFFASARYWSEGTFHRILTHEVTFGHWNPGGQALITPCNCLWVRHNTPPPECELDSKRYRALLFTAIYLPILLASTISQ
jgi:hypothetical protein